MSRDSYYEMLEPFFSNHFARSEYVGLARPIPKEDWTWMIETIQPDVIIEEMLERNLKSVPIPGNTYPIPTDNRSIRPLPEGTPNSAKDIRSIDS